MVRYSENDELDNTQPHRSIDQTQPAKAVRKFENDDQQNTVVALAVRNPIRRATRTDLGDTEPLLEATEERLAVLSKVLSSAPDNPEAQRGLYLTLYRYLQRFPFLRYLEENERLYRVITGEGRVIAVPKDRAVTPPYPPKSISPLQRSYRWLGYSLVGLLLAGLGALVCAPVAAMFAWRAARESQSMDYRNRAGMALIYAFMIWSFGLLFGFLFLFHL